jgi:oligopeptidase B
VLGYLKAENAYFEAAMKPHEALVETLFQEMKGGSRRTTPRSRSRMATGSTGRRSRRARNIATGIANPRRRRRALIYSENAEAEGKEYFRLGAFAVSPDGNLLATLVDDDGSERFKLVVRDLATGKDIETVTEVGIGHPVWTSDSTKGPGLHRGQRPVAQLPRPLSPHRRRSGQGGDAL